MDEDEANLKPIDINDFEISLSFIDSVSYTKMLKYSILSFATIYFFIFSITQFPTYIRISSISETTINHTVTKDSLDIDFTLHNLQYLNKYLTVEARAFSIENSDEKPNSNTKSNLQSHQIGNKNENKLNENKSIENKLNEDDEGLKLDLNVSSRYVLKNNYEVIDSNTSLFELTTFTFNKGESQPIPVFQDVVANFDYLNVHFYINGDLSQFKKFTFIYDYSDPRPEKYFQVLLQGLGALMLIITIFYRPWKASHLRLKLVLSLMSILGIIAAFSDSNRSNTKKFLFLVFFNSTLRYFLISQLIYVGYQKYPFFVDLIFILVSVIYSLFEFSFLKERNEVSYLPFNEQQVLLMSEKLFLIVNIIFFLFLASTVSVAKTKCHILYRKRLNYLILISVLLFISTIFTIMKIVTLDHTLSIVPMAMYFLTYYVLSELTINYFALPEYEEFTPYNNLNDVDLNVDKVSE
ncbi:hypothetical protein TRFO_35174 [Tritrichomonas foetus]|uniref:Uncharacterized protein n=1 Tax=Tritrichomonas foetus TaxID=1144522 RepID=A0A1J4JGY8_9EUKA|nr:hypothetical protein TRFO_35174 [Tritrichomonas foetus]|eukprot:OHS98432.1 hypothetical protein TRFO_35174 [Tritrichomonas foetus]